MRLGEKHYSPRERAINIIELPFFYSKEDIQTVYEQVKNDNRLSLKTKNDLLDKLRRIYKKK